ncbi:cytochrome C oxidase subunit IV family protein [bacterium]|nr:cytochrome C oxidase subunit IV family protein [bacterium]
MSATEQEQAGVSGSAALHGGDSEDGGHGAPPQQHGGLAHIAPLGGLLATFGALMILTVVTVAASWVDLGKLNLVIALMIAVVKATLVVLFFMHLRHDRPFNAIVFVASLFFVVLFIGLALMDTVHYQPDVIPGYAPEVGR